MRRIKRFQLKAKRSDQIGHCINCESQITQMSQRIVLMSNKVGQNLVFDVTKQKTSIDISAKISY